MISLLQLTNQLLGFLPFNIIPLYFGLRSRNPYYVGKDFEDVLLPTILEREAIIPLLRVDSCCQGQTLPLMFIKVSSCWGIPFMLLLSKLLDVHCCPEVGENYHVGRQLLIIGCLVYLRSEGCIIHNGIELPLEFITPSLPLFNLLLPSHYF